MNKIYLLLISGLLFNALYSTTEQNFYTNSRIVDKCEECNAETLSDDEANKKINAVIKEIFRNKDTKALHYLAENTKRDENYVKFVKKNIENHLVISSIYSKTNHVFNNRQKEIVCELYKKYF